MVQVAPMASVLVAVQLPPRAKSAAVVPASVNAFKVRAAEPLLLTVTVWAALVLPNACDAKANDAALSEMAGCAVAVPVPLRATVDGEPAAL